MLAHDGLNGFGGLICVVKRDSGDVVMEDMSLDDAVQELAANETKLAIYRSSSTTSIVPCLRLIVRKRRIGMLEKGDGHFKDTY